MRTVLKSLNLLLLAALFIGSVLVWDDLPGRIPTHFTLSGVPDAWSDKSFWSWFGLPMIALALTLLLYLLSRLIRRHPNLINLPDKKRFLELGPEGQGTIVGTVGTFVEGIALVLTFMMAMIQIDVYSSAQGAGSSILVTILVIAVPIVVLVTAIVMTVRLQGRINQLHKERVPHSGAGTESKNKSVF